ncbi:MAG: DUF2911 domain-containing protein [Bacteroidota bacterium]|nr:DUF2911 domain-containing protein [Bacteroidota bacterium]
MKKFVIYSTVIVFTILSSHFSFAQITIPSTSPLASFSQKVGLSDVTIVYSRPSAKGRKIMGDIVPYGEIWRTGANASTKFKISEELTIEGKKLAPGEYALYTQPGQDEWTVIFNKNTQLSGSDGYSEKEDAIRFKVKTHKYPVHVETFTINISDVTLKGANVEILWENTMVKFNMESDVDTKVMSQINQFTANPEASLANSYFTSASYLYETDKDLNKALEYVNKTLEYNQAFWILHLKAKIQGKMKDYKNAISTAEASIAKAKEANNKDYIKLNEKAIAEWKNKK